MHTTYAKISSRERDSAPRYYYKRTQSHSCFQRFQSGCRQILAFLFTQVGVCCLVAGYMIMGAVIFAAVEAESQMKEAEEAQKMRNAFAVKLWNVTLHTNVLYGRKWHREAGIMLAEFQEKVVINVQKGYTGTEPGVRIWTFSSALMYSLTVFTTIGYGNLTPKTDAGKLLTIAYALVGIPLMLLYMSNIGNILGSSFKYTYSKICRCQRPTKNLPTKAVLPSVLATDVSPVGSAAAAANAAAAAASGTQRGSKSKRSSDSFNSGGTRKSSLKKRQQQQQKGNNLESPTESIKPALIVSPTPPRTPSVKVANFFQSDDVEANHENSKLSVPVKPATPSTPSPGIRRFFSVRSKSAPQNSNKEDEERETSPCSSSTFSNSPPQKSTATVEFKLVEDLRLVTVPVTACLIVLIIYVGIGTVLFSIWEGWNYLDGIYFCFTSLLTIGFGDFVPGNDYIYQVQADLNTMEAKAKLIIGTVYILLGMALLAMCLNLMQEKLIQQVRTFGRRIGLLRPARFDED